MGDEAASLALSAVELRVLGSLVEKAATTPQSYPLTLNSLRLACNQSTGRDPVVAYSDLEVETALTSLRSQGLLRIVHSPSNRAAKYRHVLGDALEIGPAEQALLGVLMLRGPQTAGELNGRTERMHPFDGLGAVQTTLEALAGLDPPLTRRLDRRPGQKDARWVQCLGADDPEEQAGPEPHRPDRADVDGRPEQASPGPASGRPSADSARIDELATEVSALRDALAELRVEVVQLRESLGG